MKIISLLLSLLVFAASGYFFVKDWTNSTDTNYLIYMSLLVVLMLVCVVGVLTSLTYIIKQRRKAKRLMYNSYSERRIKNNEFDQKFEIFTI